MTDQPTLGKDSVSQGLLSALKEDEQAIVSAYRELADARTKYDVATRRYAAMREAVRARLGVSPYSKEVAWPGKYYERTGHYEFRFRYVEMQVGDAVTEVLINSEDPLTLDEIASQLGSGGLYFRDIRAVNAALIKTKNILKEDGKYRYEEGPPDDVDDLPF